MPAYDPTMPLTLGALIQAITPLIGAIAFLFALRQIWRAMVLQREHDRELGDARMAHIEATMKLTLEELKMMRETLMTVANQGLRLDFLEKTMDDLRRGVGYIRQPA